MRATGWAPSPQVLRGGDEPPWLVRGPLGPTGGLWGVWTPLARSTSALACCQAGRREVCSSGCWLPVSTPTHAPAQAKHMFQPCSLRVTASHWCWGNHDQERTRAWDAEATWSQRRAWVGQWCPLLAVTQAVPQEKPRSLTVATPATVHPPYVLRGHAGPRCPVVRLYNRVRAGEAGDSD